MKTTDIIGVVIACVICAGITGAVTNILTTNARDKVANHNAVQADEEAEARLLKYADKAFINGVCGGTQKCSFRLAYQASQYSQPTHYRVTEEGVVIKEGFGLADHLPRKCTGLPETEDLRATCTVVHDMEVIVRPD